jgi:flagellar hook assembly protein FlgD
MKKLFFCIFTLFVINQSTAQTITLISLNGGESLTVGAPFNIAWSFTASTPAQDVFTIELLVNNNPYRIIATNVASTAIPFSWNVPIDLADRGDYRIRVSRTTNSSSNDVSDANFAIRGGRTIAISAPTSTSVLTRGTNFNITWATNFVDNVKIDLLVNGVFSQTLNNSVSGNSFMWTVPALQNIGNNYQIRITSITDSNIVATSGTFAVEQTLTITSPNGGESFTKGSMQTIRWTTSTNVSDNVKIELVNSFGTIVQVISASSTANLTMFSWTVPMGTPDGANYRIRITSLTNPNLIDESNETFGIGTFLVVTTPTAGSVLNKGTKYTIRWTTTIFALLRVELILNGIVVRFLGTNIPSNTVNSLEWTPEADLASNDGYLIRVISLADANQQGISSTFSIIAPPSIQVNSPVGGEVWQKNKPYNITWQSGVQGNLRIDLFKNNALLQNIAPSISATSNVFSWLIPNTIPSGNDYKINITSLATNNVSGQSPANFTIADGDSIKITNPIANANLIKNTNFNITWTTNISSRNITIELIREGFLITTIATNQANNGSFSWRIPTLTENDQPIATGAYRLRIRTTNGDLVTDTSPLFNIIEPTFQIATPNGGEQFVRGFSYPISWNSNLEGGVRIDLYNSNVTLLSNISMNATGGTFNWLVPADLPEAAFYSIRITSLTNSTLSSASLSNFRVLQGQLQVTNPRGGENWYSNGFRYNIQWTNNTQKPVRVELVRAGNVVTTINSSTLASTLDFTLPDGLADASDYRIRVSSIENNTLVAESNFIRIIRPVLTLTSPRGGESLIQELRYEITWQSNLPADELVQIDLYIGNIFNRIINPSTPSGGNAFWDIGANIPVGTNYNLRVSILRNPNIFGQTAAPFSVIRDNVPPVISGEDFPALFNGSDGAVLSIDPSINVTDNLGVSGLKIECIYKSISKADWTTGSNRTQGVLQPTGRYRAPIPQSEFRNEIGVEYYFEVTDRAGNVVRSPREGTLKPQLAHIRYANQNIPNPIFGETVEDYQIVAIPLVLNDNTVKGIFEKVLQPYDDQNWRLLRYEGGTLSEVNNAEKPLTQIEPGKGYWLIVKSKPLDNLTTGEGTTVRVSSLTPFSLNLEAGWNQIGNPYTYNLSWADILKGNADARFLGSLKTYDKGYKNTDILPLYRGGFVFAAQPLTLKFPTAKNRTINTGRIENEEITNPLSAPIWEVKLRANAGKTTNEFAGFGMNPSAEMLKDQFDDMTLPRFGNYLEVNFNRPAYFYPKFAKDVVPTKDNFVWEFTVEANTQDKTTKLEWENAYFGNEKKLMLLDQELQRFVDMSTTKEYAFTRTVDKYRFKAIFGDEKFVMENLQSDKIVFDNFPNPFQNQTQFNFTLPLEYAGSHVSFKIYNLMGQEVATLTNQSYSAGFHQLRWEAKDQYGNFLAKGLYICRLQIESKANGLHKVLSRSVIVE